MNQKEMERVYEEQHTEKGRTVLQNQTALVNRFNQIIHSDLKAGRIEMMINERTGEKYYFVAE